MVVLTDLWPLFGLRIETPRLTLRLPTDDDLAQLATLAAGGVHQPGWVPFGVDWTSGGSPRVEQDFLRYHWRVRGEVEPDDWRLELAVLVGGTPIGCQGISGRDFGLLRAVTTGSWLGRRHHGKGYGTEMRAAVLELAFGHLGAVEARSSARADNGPSLGVSSKLGYRPNGTSRERRGQEAVTEQHVRLDRRGWEEARPDLAIEVRGLEPCRPLLGA